MASSSYETDFGNGKDCELDCEVIKETPQNPKKLLHQEKLDNRNPLKVNSQLPKLWHLEISNIKIYR